MKLCFRIKYEVLKKWVEELKGLLIKQKQENLFGHLIGRLLAYSPIGADSYHPCEAVRKIIEEYDSDRFYRTENPVLPCDHRQSESKKRSVIRQTEESLCYLYLSLRSLWG